MSLKLKVSGLLAAEISIWLILKVGEEKWLDLLLTGLLCSVLTGQGQCRHKYFISRRPHWHDRVTSDGCLCIRLIVVLGLVYVYQEETVMTCVFSILPVINVKLYIV